MAQALHGPLGARGFPHPTLFWTLQEASVDAPLLMNLSPTLPTAMCVCAATPSCLIVVAAKPSFICSCIHPPDTHLLWAYYVSAAVLGAELPQ